MINVSTQRAVAIVTIFALVFSFAPFNSVEFAKADVGDITLDNVNGSGTGPYTADGTWETINGQPCWNQGQDFRYFIEVFDDLDDSASFDEGEPVLQTVDPAPCNGDFEGSVSNDDKDDGGEWPANGQEPDPSTFDLEPGTHNICAVLYHVGQQGNDIVSTNCLNGDIVVPPAPQCSDEEDNDGDGLTDIEDPGCHTDGDAGNEESYDPEDDDETDEVQPPQCSDNVDNEDAEDTLADELDPGCHTDGDAGNSESYDPQDDDETDESTGVEICGDGIDNDGDEQIDEDCPEICGDGIDNDGDEQIDEDCPEICDNQQDDDGDDLVDENDPDCDDDVPVFQCEADEFLHLVSDPTTSSSFDSPLYRVETATGDDDLITSFTDTQFHFALAMDRFANVFSLRSDENLVELNGDGTVDEVGATSGFSTVVALGFAYSGELYALDQDTDKLYEIDPTDGSTTDLGVITEAGNSENTLNVYGGDLVVNEDGNIIYVRGNDAGDSGDPGVGSVFEIDINSGTYTKLGELTNGPVDVFLITSLAQSGDTYYALERTDVLYTFTLDPFNFIVSGPDGDRHYSVGDAASCPVQFKDDDDGSISGTKFDTQENRIKDWVIYLFNEAGQFIDQVLTDENGDYLFDSLADGNYIVCEEDMVGWEQTWPTEGANCDEVYGEANYAPKGHDVTLNAEDNDSDENNFVNRDLDEICDNQQDDDEDGLVDNNDPDCDDGGGGDDTQCSDNIDNEDPEDELADELDPGCWEDPNDSETYDSSDNDETDPEDVCPQDEGIQTNENQCTDEEEEQSSTGGGGSGGGTVLLASCDAVPSSTTTGTLVTFTADVNAVADEPVSYGWAGAVNGSGQQISATFNAPGTYVAFLSALDAEGRNDTASCSVEVTGTAIPPFTGLPGGTGGTGGTGGAGTGGGTGGIGGAIAQEPGDGEGQGIGTTTLEELAEEEEGPGFLAGILSLLDNGLVLWIIIILLILLVLWWLFGRRKDDEDKGKINPR